MKEWEKLEPIYNMILQAHAHKQIQIYITAKIIAQKLVAKAKLGNFYKAFFVRYIFFRNIG